VISSARETKISVSRVYIESMVHILLWLFSKCVYDDDDDDDDDIYNVEN